MKQVKTNVQKILEQKKINHTILTYPHSNEAVDGEKVAEYLNEDPNCVFKTLVTKSTTKPNTYYVFVVPVLNNLDLKKAAKVVDEKAIEMVHVKDLLSITGYIRGGCSPIGMKKQFPTIFDETIILNDYIIFSAGMIGYQVKITPNSAVNLTNAIIADIIK